VEFAISLLPSLHRRFLKLNRGQVFDPFGGSPDEPTVTSPTTLLLDAPGSFTGKIRGLVNGDRIDLAHTPIPRRSRG
jgi:hypothetical protein